MALIKPEVYSGLVREKFKGKVKILNLANNVGEIENFRNVGETIVFPKWNLASEPSELKKGDGISTEELSQIDSKATIKQVGHGIVVYDMENLTALGNQIDEGATQQGLLFARKLDADLIIEAKTTDLKSPTTNGKTITETELDNSLQLYGDDRDITDFAGIVIHSLLIPSFYKMECFVSNANTTSTPNNGLIVNGLLGYFRGIPVFVSDKGTLDTANNECCTLVIKKNSLGYMMKRNINIELEREAKYKRTNLYADMIYATKLLDESGIVVVKKTIA